MGLESKFCILINMRNVKDRREFTFVVVKLFYTSQTHDSFCFYVSGNAGIGYWGKFSTILNTQKGRKNTREGIKEGLYQWNFLIQSKQIIYLVFKLQEMEEVLCELNYLYSKHTLGRKNARKRIKEDLYLWYFIKQRK